MVDVAVGIVVYNMKRLRAEPCRTPMFKGQGRLEEEELAREINHKK